MENKKQLKREWDEPEIGETYYEHSIISLWDFSDYSPYLTYITTPKKSFGEGNHFFEWVVSECVKKPNTVITVKNVLKIHPDIEEIKKLFDIKE